MAYGYYRTYRRHQSQRDYVSAKYGGVDRDVLTAVVALAPASRDRLFQAYADHFGRSKARYAEKTYRDWCSGAVNPSAATIERLLTFVPRLLPDGTKYELVRKLRQRLRRPERHELSTDASNWSCEVLPVAERLIGKALTEGLPAAVEDRLTWLSDGSAKAAQKLLAKAEALEGLIAVSLLASEFRNIERFLLANPKAKCTHLIKLPYGTIAVRIKRRQTMSNRRDDDEDRKRGALVPTRPGESLIQQSLRNLAPEELADVRKKAAEEALRLEAEQVRADQRFDNSTRDLAALSDEAMRLNRSNQDYRLKGTFKTASGTTQVDVKRETQKFIIILAALGAIVLLYVLSR